MLTEDDVAARLRRGDMTVDQAVAAFDADDQVLVYAASGLDPDTATWDQVEDAASGSADLFSALRAAGASDDQMDRIGANIERLRASGNLFP